MSLSSPVSHLSIFSSFPALFRLVVYFVFLGVGLFICLSLWFDFFFLVFLFAFSFSCLVLSFYFLIFIILSPLFLLRGLLYPTISYLSFPVSCSLSFSFYSPSCQIIFAASRSLSSLLAFPYSLSRFRFSILFSKFIFSSFLSYSSFSFIFLFSS